MGLVAADRIGQGDLRVFRGVLRQARGRGRRLGAVFLDDLARGVEDEPLAPGVERAGLFLALGLRQSGHEHAGIQFLQRVLLQILGRDDLGLAAVQGEQTLVETVLRAERRLVAQQRVEEAQARDVLAQHSHAHRQRRRQEQPDATPQPRPEDRRHHDRHRRQPRVRAVKPRFEHVAGDQFDRGE